MKPICPDCRKKKHVHEITMPVVSMNTFKKPKEQRAWICDRCSTMFIDDKAVPYAIKVRD